MSGADRKRWQLIAVVAFAAILNVIATKAHSKVLGWLGFVVLFFAILLFVRWRRAAVAERRGRVFDR